MEQQTPAPTRLLEISRKSLDYVWISRGVLPPGDTRSEYIIEVSNILMTNISTGRWLRVVRNNLKHAETPEKALYSYGRRVATYYWEERVRVSLLVDGNEAAWGELCGYLEQRAYNILVFHLNMPNELSRDQACDHAQDACERILRGRYPYDIPFNAWAARILDNCIKDLFRSKDLLDRVLVADASLTDVESIGDRYEYTVPRSPFESIDDVDERLQLMSAIARLPSQAQQQVVMLSLQGMEDSDIASQLGKSVQAVYNLRHRAVRELSKLLV